MEKPEPSPGHRIVGRGDTRPDPRRPKASFFVFTKVRSLDCDVKGVVRTKAVARLAEPRSGRPPAPARNRAALIGCRSRSIPGRAARSRLTRPKPPRPGPIDDPVENAKPNRPDISNGPSGAGNRWPGSGSILRCGCKKFPYSLYSRCILARRMKVYGNHLNTEPTAVVTFELMI